MSSKIYLAHLGFGFLCYVFWVSWPDWYWYRDTKFVAWLMGWAGFWGYRLPWPECKAAVAEGEKR